MYALDIQSIYQIEINGLTNMLRVTISIRYIQRRLLEGFSIDITENLQELIA